MEIEENLNQIDVAEQNSDSGEKKGFNLIMTFITYGLFMALSWAVPWSIIGEDCLPGGNIFNIILVLDCSVLLGFLVGLIKLPNIPTFPPLLGMLLAGFCLRNIPGINFSIQPEWSSSLRNLALAIILIKAGLELDSNALKTMKGTCIRLTALPCITETLACGLSCYLLLGFSIEWGLLLGFVLGAVTPAVIVPSLLLLQDMGYGIRKGIPTLVVAASSFDDVLAISGFSIMLSISFAGVEQNLDSSVSEVINTTTNNSLFHIATTSVPIVQDTQSGGELALVILRGPLEMIGGILIGILLGVGLWYIPNSEQTNINLKRTLLVCGLGIFSLFGGQKAGFPGSGALAAIVAPFTASFRWQNDKIPVSDSMGILWTIFEPFLFGLIGAEIAIDTIEASTVGIGLCVLFIGLLFRVTATFGAVSWSGFNLKEKIFICFAWLPKATVQAAIGSVALDTARKLNAPEEIINIGSQILTISVLAILITAPLGALAIGISGPILLEKSEVKNNDDIQELESLNKEEDNDEVFA